MSDCHVVLKCKGENLSGHLCNLCFPGSFNFVKFSIRWYIQHSRWSTALCIHYWIHFTIVKMQSLLLKALSIGFMQSFILFCFSLQVLSWSKMAKLKGSMGWALTGDRSIEFWQDPISFINRRIEQYNCRIFIARTLNKPTVFVCSWKGVHQLLRGEASSFYLIPRIMRLSTDHVD